MFIVKRLNRRFILAGIFLAAGLVLGGWTLWGNFYRHSIEQQTDTWFDGKEQYTFTDYHWDSFDNHLYIKIRSVRQAAEYIQNNYKIQTEKDMLDATYDFTRRRFMHFMYPRHTWITNPYLAFVETIFPKKPYNEIALANDKLRHSAVASCGHATNVFIEIYRELGGSVREVAFDGHIIAEAKINGQQWFVDVNLEAIKKGKVKKVSASRETIEEVYSHLSDSRREHYIKVFKSIPSYGGYDGPVFNSPRIYTAQLIIDRLKWVLPAILIFVGSFLVWRARKQR